MTPVETLITEAEAAVAGSRSGRRLDERLRLETSVRQIVAEQVPQLRDAQLSRYLYLVTLLRELRLGQAAADLLRWLPRASIGGSGAIPHSVQASVAESLGWTDAAYGLLTSAASLESDPAARYRILANLSALAMRSGGVKATRAWVGLARGCGMDEGYAEVAARVAAAGLWAARQTADRDEVDRSLRDLRAAAGRVVDSTSADDIDKLLILGEVAGAEYELARAGSVPVDQRALAGTLDSVSQRLCAALGAYHPRALPHAAAADRAALDLACDSGDPAAVRAALGRLRETAARTRSVLGERHPDSVALVVGVAAACFELARTEHSLHDARTAVGDLRTASDVATRALGNRHPHAVVALVNLAGAEFELASHEGSPAQTQRALAVLESADAAARATFGSRHPSAVAVHHNLVACRSLADDGGPVGRGDVTVRERLQTRSGTPDAGFGEDRYVPAATESAAGEVVPATPRSADIGWQGRYPWLVCLLDLVAGVIGAQLVWVPPGGRSLWLALALPFGWLVCLAANGAYRRVELIFGDAGYVRVVRSAVALAAALVLVSVAVGSFPAWYQLGAVALTAVLGIAGRYAATRRLHAGWRRGERLHRVLLVGPARAAVELTDRLRRERQHGLGVVGVCLTDRPGAGPVQAGPLPVYGTTLDEAPHPPPRPGAGVVLVLPRRGDDAAAMDRMAWQVRRAGVELMAVGTLPGASPARATVRMLDGLPLLHVRRPRLAGGRMVVKEVFDRAVALLLLILATPLLAVIAMLLRLPPGGSGPAIVRQERVGRNGRLFVRYTFRTVHVGFEDWPELDDFDAADVELFKQRDYPRMTRVGRWLHRFSLDGIPQLVNVVKGDMSLVGPRAPLAREVAGHPADMDRRLAVKPGLTGLSQVSGRPHLSWDESADLDLRYAENWSLALDLAILGRAVVALFRSRRTVPVPDAGTAARASLAVPDRPADPLVGARTHRSPLAVDVAVITVLGRQMRAVVDLMRTAGWYPPASHEGMTFHSAEFTTDRGPVLTVATQVVAPGPLHVLAAFERLRRYYAPKVVVLLGMATGIRPDLGPGDVAVSTEVINHDAGWGDVQPVPAVVRHAIEAFFDQYGRPCRLAVPGADGVLRICTVLPGPIGSGAGLAGSPWSTVRRHRTVPIAVQTEAAGLVQALDAEDDPAHGWLTICGISDHADLAKEDRRDEIAAWHAAAVLEAMLPFLSLR
jgi:lipopolysaccharide/colanic/teichoic acid biosynthesis glycosyltransferase/nucleoside phosphorylase